MLRWLVKAIKMIMSECENKTRVCKNVTKIGRCNIIDHIKDFGIDLLLLPKG